MENIRPGHDAPDLPASTHEHGLAVEEQHFQDSGALAQVNDHRFDVFYERNGVLPPCKRKPGDPYCEPSQ